MSTELVEQRSQGEHYVAPLAPLPNFADAIGRHHKPQYDDYNMAKIHITTMIGDISDIDIFGRQVLCAVFVRPNTNMIRMPSGETRMLYLPVKEVREDFYQNKTVMILKCGPDAFQGDAGYLDAQFGKDVKQPGPGDWLFANASAGIQVSLVGDGAKRCKALDQRGEEFDIFEWSGWPCRIMGDDNFLGRLTKPHFIV